MQIQDKPSSNLSTGSKLQNEIIAATSSQSRNIGKFIGDMARSCSFYFIFLREMYLSREEKIVIKDQAIYDFPSPKCA